MKVFISYSSSDETLAKRLADTLRAAGLEVWDDTDIMPGENWAAKTAEALQEADAMVVLLTPDALRSRQVSHELAYALGKKSYSGRLIPVLAAPPEQISTQDIPWILTRFPVIRLPEYDREEEGLKEIARALIKGASGIPV